MGSFLRRYAPLLLITTLGLSIAGCAAYAADDIIRGPSSDRHRIRLDRDVRRYVRTVDRQVRLDRRQERAVDRLLRDHSYRLLERTHPADRQYVYPFPRSHYRTMNSAQREFWRDVDRRIERSLTRGQTRRYRNAVVRVDDRQGPHVDRGDRDDRDDRRDRRDRRRDRRSERTNRR